jgi:hypothetical protein
MTGNLMLRVAVKAVAAGALACAAASTLGGCYATVQPDYVEAPAPPNIEAYPSVVYDGHPTYFYNNRWYYRGGGGAWVNYRVEPPELQRRRPEVMNRRPAEGRGEVRGEVRVEEHR